LQNKPIEPLKSRTAAFSSPWLSEEMDKNEHQSSLQESPEREDIRMLGRLLGEVIREQEGEDVFNLVEQVRRMAVSLKRSPNPVASDSLRNMRVRVSSNVRARGGRPG